VVAGEWLESGVLTTVSDEIRRLTEGLATLTTNVWLLAYTTFKRYSHQISASQLLQFSDGKT